MCRGLPPGRKTELGGLGWPGWLISTLPGLSSTRRMLGLSTWQVQRRKGPQSLIRPRTEAATLLLLIFCWTKQVIRAARSKGWEGWIPLLMSGAAKSHHKSLDRGKSGEPRPVFNQICHSPLYGLNCSHPYNWRSLISSQDPPRSHLGLITRFKVQGIVIYTRSDAGP